MFSKTHHTAVAVLPPQEIWEPIQAIRRRHDRQFRRWMPHINLLYPFLPRAQWPVAVPRLLDAAQRMPAFQITLAIFRSFTHPSGHTTLWLAPEPATTLLHLQATLQAAVPACDDQSRFPGGFTPHLSVGQARSPQTTQHLLGTWQATWRPVRFTVTAVAVIWRQGESPFQVGEWIPLSSAADCGAALPHI
jgi:2'-5' RNA ligase